MDLNENSLDSASERIRHIEPRRLVANVLEPLPSNAGPYDSIGVNYLFHCVPGSWAEKGEAFGHLADRLDDRGVLFGATILGDGAAHNLGGRSLMALYNRLGIFHNREDDAEPLRDELLSRFDDVSLDVVGTVAVFSARRPRR